MDSGNESVGLKTNNQTNKLVQEAKDRLRSAQVDYDFYSTPFDFSSVDSHSANHFFGNSKWKQSCKDAFGLETFDKHSDKYGNKPVDFKIASFVTNQVNYFRPEEKISITDKNGTYTSSGKVLTTDPKHVTVMLPFLGTSSGKITNVSRMMGAQKAVEKYSQIIKDIEPTPEVKLPVSEQKVEETKQPISKEFAQLVTDGNAATAQKINDDSSKLNTALKVFAFVAIIVIVLAFISYSSKKKK